MSGPPIPLTFADVLRIARRTVAPYPLSVDRLADALERLPVGTIIAGPRLGQRWTRIRTSRDDAAKYRSGGGTEDVDVLAGIIMEDPAP